MFSVQFLIDEGVVKGLRDFKVFKVFRDFKDFKVIKDIKVFRALRDFRGYLLRPRGLPERLDFRPNFPTLLSRT